MTHHPVVTDTSLDLDASPIIWAFDPDGNQFPVIARTRRNVTIDRHGERIRLKRRRLENSGFDVVGGTTYSVTTYQEMPS